MKELIKHESDKTIDDRILDVTMILHEKFPELSTFLPEMPVTIPITNNPSVDRAAMQEYYESLVSMLKSYELELETKKSNQTE